MLTVLWVVAMVLAVVSWSVGGVLAYGMVKNDFLNDLDRSDSVVAEIFFCFFALTGPFGVMGLILGRFLSEDFATLGLCYRVPKGPC